MECEFCKKTFANISSLNKHKKCTKFCLKMQNISPDNIHKCKICEKGFNIKTSCDRHESICIITPSRLIDEIEELKKLLLSQQLENLERIIDDKNDQIKKLEENNTKELKIQYLTKKYVKKQSRQEYEERYVVYILTTPSLKKDRRYILGKAENLTNRLSTYNKTDEHEVVYYQKCGDEDGMRIVENLVFKKLQDYREQANRERFVLPEDKEIELFIDVVKKSIKFIS